MKCKTKWTKTEIVRTYTPRFVSVLSVDAFLSIQFTGIVYWKKLNKHVKHKITKLKTKNLKFYIKEVNLKCINSTKISNLDLKVSVWRTFSSNHNLNNDSHSTSHIFPILKCLRYDLKLIDILILATPHSHTKTQRI